MQNNNIYQDPIQNKINQKKNIIEALNNMSEIEKITMKNKINKIENAYLKYKNKTSTTSQYTNENKTTDIDLPGIEFIGQKDNKGNKIGFGIQKMRDGSKFRGVYINDKVNGWGIYEHKDGDIYRGEYQNDRTCGYGEYSHANGAVYYGYWNNDMQYGIGFEIWEDSSQYSGEYDKGKKEGIGTYIWQDQTMYRGEWKFNNLHGYGIYNYSDGRIYSGEWKNNKMHGYGEFSWVDGKKYIGFYKNDQRDGFGIYYWPNNRFFIGFWKEGKQNGIGRYIKGETAKYGIWENGKRESWLNNEEFANCLEPRDENYIFIFQMNNIQIKKFLELDQNDSDEKGNNKLIFNFSHRKKKYDEYEEDDD